MKTGQTGFVPTGEEQMTYCVAVRVDAGLVLLSDTRTNAGVDNIARFRKTFTYENPGERAIALMTSGNLSVTQEVKTTLSRAIKESAENPEIQTLLNCRTMHDAVMLVGDAMRKVRTRMRQGMTSAEPSMSASILVAGQRKGGKQRLYMVYSEGNFIEATADTPFFQIGEQCADGPEHGCSNGFTVHPPLIAHLAPCKAAADELQRSDRMRAVRFGQRGGRLRIECAIGCDPFRRHAVAHRTALGACHSYRHL